MEERTYCMGCMRMKPAGVDICPHCGFSLSRYRREEYVLKPGTCIGPRGAENKYLIGKTLGQGGFGITYIGLDTTLKLRVAIKEYYPAHLAYRPNGFRSLRWHCQPSDKESGLETFLREARKMAKIDNIPGIVRVREIFDANDTAYIIMDYVEGETLLTRLQKNGRMSPDECFRLLRPLTESLSKAHQRGLIHRDIKPDNIMIDEQGEIWLLDMGAAKDLDASSARTQSTQMVVSHGFSPPEQYSSGHMIGAWTDVYALCATINYCMSGTILPMATDRLTNPALQDVRPYLAGNLPPAVANVLTKGLAVQPRERYQSMDELKNAFETALGLRQSPSPPPPPPPSPSQEPPSPGPTIPVNSTTAANPTNSVTPTGKTGNTILFAGIFAVLCVIAFLLYRQQMIPAISASTETVPSVSSNERGSVANPSKNAESQEYPNDEYEPIPDTPTDTPAPTDTPIPTDTPTPPPTSTPTPPPTSTPTPYVTSAQQRLQEFINYCDSQLFDPSTFEGFDKQMASYARNAIFAHAGRKFSDASGLQSYFSQYDWYYPWIEPNDFKDINYFNQYETKNLYRILNYEMANGWRASQYTASYNRMMTFINNCDSRYFSASDLSNLDADMCILARNGIFAKSGRMFDSEYLTAFYEECFSWYYPRVSPDDFSDNMLNDYQKKNLDIVMQFERDMGYK